MSQQWQDFLATQSEIVSNNLASLESDCCLIPLMDFGVLHVTGNDAKTFLQGQVTCNLNDVTVNQSMLGAHCNLKGRMQSLFRIFQDEHDSAYFLMMPASMLAPASTHFKKYALFSKVSFDATNSMMGLGVYGSHSKELLCKMFGEITQLIKPYDSLIIKTSTDTYYITLLPGQHTRFEIWGNANSIKSLWMSLTTYCKVLKPLAWELLEIQAGIPTIYPQTIDQVLPHHANLSILNGISYTKGCYLGQEIIARMQYRGKIKKHLYRAYVQGSTVLPQPGTEIFTGADTTEPGIVLRSAINDLGNIELLVVMDDKYSNFENVSLNLADEPKVLHLDLPYNC